MAGQYIRFCNDCNQWGPGKNSPEDARYEALEHGHNDVQVEETRSSGNFVLWRSTDGRGEDGEIHIH